MFDHRSVAAAASRSGRRWSWRRTSAVAGGCLVLANLRWPDGPVGETTYLTVGFGASAMAWLAAARLRSRVSTLIALALSLSATGDLVFSIYGWVGSEAPDVSVADVGWLGSYVAVGGALLGLLHAKRDAMDADAWIDVIAVTFVALLIQWEVAVSPIISADGTPLSVRMVWALYPALDSVLVALVIRASMAGVLRGRTAAALAGGAVSWFAADLGYTLLAPSGSVTVWLNAGWLVGAMLLAAGAWHPVSTGKTSAGRHDRGELRVGPVRIALGLTPLLLPGAIEIIEWGRGEDPNPVGLYGATVVLVGLAFARALILAREGERARTLLRARARLERAVAETGSDATLLVDANGIIQEEAAELVSLIGRPGASAIGWDIFDLVAPIDVGDARAVFSCVLADPRRTFEGEMRVRHADGHLLWLGVRSTNLLADPDVHSVIVSVHDISTRKSIELELEHRAFHDTLTGLANRALFADRTQQALRRGVRTGHGPAVIFLDLDGFKTVNDSLGHTAGDELLREVATRILGAVRPGDTVARFGGDEFSVLIDQSGRPIAEAEIVAERILSTLSAPISVSGQRVVLSASIGIAVGGPGDTAASLMRDADVAMYRAKGQGKGRWVVHDEEMRAAAVERLRLETEIVGALDAGQLRLVYQPVVELATGDLVGFEALLRWHHPTLGVISPDRFIPLAEDNGLIVPIGAWVLHEACRTLARWHNTFAQHGRLSISVNVSARQIASTSLLGEVRDALAESGLDPARLVLEITETALIQDATVAAARLGELRRLGVRLAIDDFGTGYSSLSYLRQFPVDVLKIDRSFIGAVRDPAEVPAILRGLLDLGRTLEVTMVAEGVEDDVQRTVLRNERCDQAQGFLFARPLEPEDAEILLAQTKDARIGPAVLGTV